MIYFDTSLLIKLQVEEPGSVATLNFVRARNEVLVTSEVTRTEVAAALHRKLREGLIDHGNMIKASKQFLRELEVGRIVTLSFTKSIIHRVEESFQLIPADTFLRAGDAIHLATAAEAGLKEIYSNDRHLLAAAPVFKLKGINPLAR